MYDTKKSYVFHNNLIFLKEKKTKDIQLTIL